MGLHCGVDIIEIDRIKKALDSGGKAFKDRVFTEREIMYCEARKASKYQSYAARFAERKPFPKLLAQDLAKDFCLRILKL